MLSLSSFEKSDFAPCHLAPEGSPRALTKLPKAAQPSFEQGAFLYLVEYFDLAPQELSEVQHDAFAILSKGPHALRFLKETLAHFQNQGIFAKDQEIFSLVNTIVNKEKQPKLRRTLTLKALEDTVKESRDPKNIADQMLQVLKYMANFNGSTIILNEFLHSAGTFCLPHAVEGMHISFQHIDKLPAFFLAEIKGKDNNDERRIVVANGQAISAKSVFYLTNLKKPESRAFISQGNSLWHIYHNLAPHLLNTETRTAEKKVRAAEITKVKQAFSSLDIKIPSAENFLAGKRKGPNPYLKRIRAQEEELYQALTLAIQPLREIKNEICYLNSILRLSKQLPLFDEEEGSETLARVRQLYPELSPKMQLVYDRLNENLLCLSEAERVAYASAIVAIDTSNRKIQNQDLINAVQRDLDDYHALAEEASKLPGHHPYKKYKFDFPKSLAKRYSAMKNPDEKA